MSQNRTATASKEVDLRSLIHADRNRKAFQLIRALAVGTSFVFVNDHDSKSLHHQLQTEYLHQFFWNYLQEGPDVWRIQIGRLQKAA